MSHLILTHRALAVLTLKGTFAIRMELAWLSFRR